MFDIAPSEFLLVAFVALVVIGPKDLPKAMRVVGYWVGKARGVARQFRSGFDSMVREAELEEMEKRWASENERIMREHPQIDSAQANNGPPVDDGQAHAGQIVHSPETDLPRDDHTSEPVMVEKPVVSAAVEHSASQRPANQDDEPSAVAERGPDLFDASNANDKTDKTGKSDVASS